MVKNTQTFRRQIADELFRSVWPFCGIDVEKVNPFLNSIPVYALWKHKAVAQFHLKTAVLEISKIFQTSDSQIHVEEAVFD